MAVGEKGVGQGFVNFSPVKLSIEFTANGKRRAEIYLHISNNFSKQRDKLNQRNFCAFGTNSGLTGLPIYVKAMLKCYPFYPSHTPLLPAT